MSDGRPSDAAGDRASRRATGRESGATTATEPATAAAGPATGRAARSRHLYEIDVLRILTFACVIAVHTISHTVADGDWPLFGLLALVHFTREVFFALTGFVLVYSWFHRPRPMREFWPKRFLLVGVPYVVWSAIYVVVPWLVEPDVSPLGLVGRFVVETATGDAWYHLYFLLVTMQVYLLLPAILWLVKATRGHHLALLVVSFALQLAISGCYAYWPAFQDTTGSWLKVVFPAYQFFILAGAVAADHETTFLAAVRTRRRGILIGVVASGIGMLAVFALQVAIGFSPTGAGAPFQPAIMVWSVAIGLGFLSAGAWWADRRRAGGPLARTIDWASDRSFAIFLAHPFFIWALLIVGGGVVADIVPTPWLTLVTYVVVVGLACLTAELARRTPLSLPLAGRPFARRRPKA